MALVAATPMSHTFPSTSPVPRPARSPDFSSGTGRPNRNDNMRWKVIALEAGVILAGFIGYVATWPLHAPTVAYPVAAVPTQPVANTAPAFALLRLGSGPPVALLSTRDTRTAVDFFTSWCYDCQAQLGDFAALAARAQGRVAVVEVDANHATARAMLANVHATFPVVDHQATTTGDYLLTALPVTFFLDTQGRVAHVAPGTHTATALAWWTAVKTGTVG
jgi:thiol-disulfide isomerase/thioredoxin